MVGLPIEGIADRILIGQEAVGADLRNANDALAQILHKVVRSLAISLASAVGDDCTAGGAKRNVGVLIALVIDLMTLNAFLFFTDVAPNIIKLDAANANANHHAVVKLGTATADAKREPGDGLAVGIEEAGDGTLADTLTEGGNDLNLFGEGQDVHEGAILGLGDCPSATLAKTPCRAYIA